MKRKIGELRNKPIVEGDRNLLSKNEIHINEVSGGGDPDFIAFYTMPTAGGIVRITENSVYPPKEAFKYGNAGYDYILENVTLKVANIENPIKCDILIRNKFTLQTGQVFITGDTLYESYYSDASYYGFKKFEEETIPEAAFDFECSRHGLHLFRIKNKTIAFLGGDNYIEEIK